MFKGTLIRSGNNAKTIKGDDKYETAIMYLAPFTLAGANVCPMAEQAGCVAGCLNKAGLGGVYTSIQQARIAKTKRYLSDRAAFMTELADDLERFVRYCQRKGVKPAVRLNGTSDIQWEVAHPVSPSWWYGSHTSIFDLFPDVQFYDYTKVYKRAYRQLPANYALTLSYSEANPRYAEAVTKAAHDTGMNLAVVYRTKATRDNVMHSGDAFGTESRVFRQVIDGDSDDMRFLDPRDVIVGLYAKGPAKKDTSGFVVG